MIPRPPAAAGTSPFRHLAAAAVAAVALAAGGCQSSSHAFRLDLQSTWQAAVGETVAWRPDNIDSTNFTVYCRKVDLGGTEIVREMMVRRDLNPFALRPSSRVFVSIRQTRPVESRFHELERDFLMAVAAKIAAMTAPP